MGNAFHVSVGARMRQLRKLRGLTQQDLAKLLNISFQQVQKYESGANKLTYERLCQLSGALKVPMSAWEIALPSPVPGSHADPHSRQSMGLMQAFHAIRTEKHRQLLCDMAAALADLRERE